MNENLVNNVTCPKCGASVMPNTKFCVKCGNQLQGETVNNTVNNPTVPTQVEQVNVNNQVVTQNRVQTHNSNDNIFLNSLKYILNVILKPFDSFKKEEDNLSKFKNVGILLAIIVGALTILNLISTMITTVRVTSFWDNDVNWVWKNLKNIQYIKFIIQNIVMYAGIIFVISGVYYLGSLVIKKETKFIKLLSATTTAFIPLALAIVISPIFSFIMEYLGLAINAVGFVYSAVILLELLNDQIVIENKNTRIYFHLACLSIILIGGGILVYNLLLGSITSGLGSLV